MSRKLLCPLVFATLALSVAADEESIPEGWATVEEAERLEPEEGPIGQPAGGIGARFDRATSQLGCRLISIEEGSIVDRAGLEEGDVIVRFDGLPTPNRNLLARLARSKRDGETAAVLYFRDGQRSEATLEMSAVDGRIAIGARVESGVPATDLDGVLVGGVRRGSAADEAGLVEGDVIESVDGAAVADPEDLSMRIDSLSAGDEIRLGVRREKGPIELSLVLPARSGPDREKKVETSYRLAVLLVEFSDVVHREEATVDRFEEMFFSRGKFVWRRAGDADVPGSVLDYYDEVSSGVFTLEGTVFDWVALDSTKDDWRNVNRNPGARKILGEAVEKLLAREGADALDGYQGISVVYAGRVEHPRGRVLWPHRSSVQIGRRKMPYYITSAGNRQGLAGIGTHCHEFGHMLGLPDQYSVRPGRGMQLGPWCLMANGTRDGRPVHLCPWCKIRLGWLEACPIDPRRGQRLALSPIEGSPTECFQVALRGNGREYLLLEYRTTTGFDEGLPRGGLLVWHVSGGSRVDLLEAHGQRSSRKDLREVPFPLPDRDSIDVDAELADLGSSDRDRWPVRIGPVVEDTGRHVLLEIGPTE